MEIVNGLITSMHDRTDSGRGTAAPARIEWSALHARFSAAHAVRAELLDGMVRNPVLAGGFANWAVSAAGNASRVVNRTDSTDGKEPAGIDDGAAGSTQTGGRGQ